LILENRRKKGLQSLTMCFLISLESNLTSQSR